MRGGKDVSYVSVIIPCYQAEPYIDRFMDCLLRQTIGFENLEVILVNDGSMDGTLGRLMWWESKYPEQIILINCEKNYGPGYAKNLGFQYATAEYVAFQDVDDVMADSFYEKLYGKIQEGFDWVSAKLMRAPANAVPDFKEPVRKRDMEYHRGPDESFAFMDLAKDTCNGIFGSLLIRMFRKQFIEENEIYFPEGLKYEDNYLSVKCSIFSNHVYIIDEILYCYYMNPNSIISSSNQHHLDRMAIEEMILELYKENGLFEKYYEQIEWKFIKKYFCDTWFAIFVKMDYIPDILSTMRKKIYDTFPNYMKNPYIVKMGIFDQMLLKMLEPEEVYTVEELEYIKEGYLKDSARAYVYLEKKKRGIQF